MIEPVTYSVSELAQRWNVTPRQILDMALQLRVPLYFNFDGLAFNVADEWHRQAGDNSASNELKALEDGIKRNEEWLKRHARGQTGEYDSLSDDEARELRADITKNQRKADELKEKLEARERERRHAEYRGMLRVPPLTLLEIMEQGETNVPPFAYRSDSPIKVVHIPARKYGGAAGPVWEGHMLALEPYGKPWGKLTADNLFAMTAEVKAIEAHQQAKASPQASAAPASAPEGKQLPWWQVSYQLDEIYQIKGETLHSKGERTSNAAIAKEIASHINAKERSKGSQRDIDSETIRKALANRKWQPE